MREKNTEANETIRSVNISTKLLVWKDTATRVVLKSAIIGYFAMWAVRQSPYLLPEALDKGIMEFDETLDFSGEYIKTTCKDLENIVGTAISKGGVIQSWNIPLKGEAPSYLFVSRYDKLEPDLDFIDLDAIARNIAHSVWLEVCYDDDFFEGGEK